METRSRTREREPTDTPRSASAASRRSASVATDTIQPNETRQGRTRETPDLETLRAQEVLLERIRKLELEQARRDRSRKRSRREVDTTSTSSEDDLEFAPEAYLDEEPPRIKTRKRNQMMKLERTYAPAQPKEFSGGNVSATREFIRRCEGVFVMQPHIYWYQREKFNYARSRLVGRVEKSWSAEERNLDPMALRWTTLKTWLLDQVQDPHNRSITFALTLFNHKQRDTQSSQHFATYLEDAEQEVQMEPLTETQRMTLLIAGLTQPLRDKLLEQQRIPYTRAELLPLLARLEQNLQRSTQRTQKQRSPRRDARPTGTQPTAGPSETKVTTVRTQRDEGARPATFERSTFEKRGPLTGPNRIPPGHCYTCGQKGHFSRECPSKNGKP